MSFDRITGSLVDTFVSPAFSVHTHHEISTYPKKASLSFEAVAIVFMAFLRLFACLELVWASDLIEWTMLFSSPEN